MKLRWHDWNIYFMHEWKILIGTNDMWPVYYSFNYCNIPKWQISIFQLCLMILYLFIVKDINYFMYKFWNKTVFDRKIFLAHLANKGFCHHLVSDVLRKLSHLNLFLWKHWTKWKQTWLGWSLLKLFPTASSCIQDGGHY